MPQPKNIYFFVHPGYGILHLKRKQEEPLRKGKKEKAQLNLKLSRAELNSIKKQFGFYGKAIQLISRKPNHEVVLIDFPLDTYNTNEPWARYLNGMKQRFNDFAKKTMGKRIMSIQMTGAQLASTPQLDEMKPVAEKIGKISKVNLFYFGEAIESCLPNAKRHFTKGIRGLQILIGQNEVLTDKSFSFNHQIQTRRTRLAKTKEKKRKKRTRNRMARRNNAKRV